jgi:hypothetical protein
MKRVEMARNHYIGVCEDTANSESALLGKVQRGLSPARDRFDLHQLAGANSMDNTRVVARWFHQESAILEKYNS